MPVLVRDLLEQVDTLAPNSINAPIKLMWMTHIQNQLFRDYPVNDLFHVFNITANLNVYSFPPDCSEDQVTSVIINGEEYPYLPMTDDEVQIDKFWTVATEMLVFFPKPTEPGKGHVRYRKRPFALTVDNLDEEPIFPADFVELLVIGCAARVYKANGNLQMASVFDADFIRLADAADRKLTKVKPKTINILRGWS